MTKHAGAPRPERKRRLLRALPSLWSMRWSPRWALHRSLKACLFAATMALLTVTVATTSGCALFGGKGSHVDWRETMLVATADANNNSPVAVDVVMVGDQDTLDKLLPLTAAQWFGSRTDLAATYPNSIRYRSWEIVPGETLRIDKRTFEGPRVIAVLVFANYGTPGAHRTRLDTFKGRVLISLKAGGYTADVQP